MNFSKNCLGEMMGPAKACTSKHDTIMTTLVVLIIFDLCSYLLQHKIEVNFPDWISFTRATVYKTKTLLGVVFCRTTV